MSLKEKRKNLDSEELRAISRQAIENSDRKDQPQVDAFVAKIEQRLMAGRFIADPDGYLSVKFWGNKPLAFAEKVSVALRKHYLEVEWSNQYGWFGTITFKVKP